MVLCKKGDDITPFDEREKEGVARKPDEVPVIRGFSLSFYRVPTPVCSLFSPLSAVLRIRNVYPGSEFFHPGSGSASKNLISFNMIRDVHPPGS
jgi:hypothetical protein